MTTGRATLGFFFGAGFESLSLPSSTGSASSSPAETLGSLGTAPCGAPRTAQPARQTKNGAVAATVIAPFVFPLPPSPWVLSRPIISSPPRRCLMASASFRRQTGPLVARGVRNYRRNGSVMRAMMWMTRSIAQQ